MPQERLTERKVESLRPHPSGKQVLYWDMGLLGFGVLVSGLTSSKSYVAQRSLNGKSRRITIGATNEMELEEAQEQAKIFLKQIKAGIDPRAEKKKVVAEQKKLEAEAMTLRQALDLYLEAGDSTLRPKTKSDYRFTIERYLKDWFDRPLREILSEDVERRHKIIPTMCRKDTLWCRW